MRHLMVVSLAGIVLSACTDTYHPEYHPVTVITSSQNNSYPVNVQPAANAPPGAPGVTIVQQAPQQ